MSTCQRGRGMVRLVLTIQHPSPPGCGREVRGKGPSDHYAVV